jgi:hypothetical protein
MTRRELPAPSLLMERREPTSVAAVSPKLGVFCDLQRYCRSRLPLRITISTSNPTRIPRRIDSAGKPGIAITTIPAVLVTTVCCALPPCIQVPINAIPAAPAMRQAVIRRRTERFKVCSAITRTRLNFFISATASYLSFPYFCRCFHLVASRTGKSNERKWRLGR